MLTIGPNTDGIPTNWPVTIEAIGTNITAAPRHLVLTAAELAEWLAASMPAYNLWLSNRLWQANAALEASMPKLIALYNQIPQGRTLMTNAQNATIGNVSQASVQIKNIALVVDHILEELQRLGPFLKQIYRVEDDSTP